MKLNALSLTVAAAALLATTSIASAASPNEMVAAEAECLVGLGFTQGAKPEDGKDFILVEQGTTERQLGGKTVQVVSGNAKIQFANNLLRSPDAMEIAAQCKYAKIANNGS